MTKYRLSFDLGVSSIGSAVIALNNDNEAADIIDAGVRIFKVSEGAADRRAKRQARKNNERTKQRLKLLSETLCKADFWPTEGVEGTKELRDLSPYAIRAHALYHKLNNPHELGRAILHMAKHRGAGFVSAMEENPNEDMDDSDDNKKKKKESSYEMLFKHMKAAEALTIGEYFHMRLNKGYRGTSLNTARIVRQNQAAVADKRVDYAIPRYLVKDEFNKIWDRQAQYCPSLTNELKEKIGGILFYERPTAPYATANCIFIEGEQRLLKAHPLAEMRRIYESVNNIRILTDGNKEKLTKEQRDTVVKGLLLKGQKANKTSVRKELFQGSRKVDIVFSDEETGIKPYLYSRPEFQTLPAFANMTDEKLTSLIEFMAEPKIEADKLGRLHNEDSLIAEVRKILGIDDDKQAGDLLALLPKGRGSLGITATRKVLELLKEDVISQREATDKLVNSGDDRFIAEEVLAQQLQGKYLQLPYYGEVLRRDTQPIHPWQKQRNKTLNPDEVKYGKVANPAVHMILNQLRLVVNDIIRIYGHPYEINIELGREVGMSAKKKNQHKQQQKKNEKLNEEAVEHLKKYKLRITRENILKYKLWKEQGCKDAFSENKIGCRFDGAEIEHLIPRAKGGSDTYNNLVLVDTNENAGKSNLFPFEFFQRHKRDEEIQAILKSIRSNSLMSDGKKWRFEPDARERFEASGDADETNRYLTDTRYMSKLAARYLRTILDFKKECETDVTNTRILVVNGSHTARLRTAWNLDGLEYDLMGLNIPRESPCEPYWVDQDTGEIKDGETKPDIDGNWRFQNTERNKEWFKKPRIDHRHHALDAIALGCINRSFMQKINWADKRGIYIKPSAYPMPLAYLNDLEPKAARAEFRKKTLSILKEVKVSHKPEHSEAGQLHKERGQSVLPLSKEHQDKIISRYNRNILDVVKSKDHFSKLAIPPSIQSEWHIDIAEDRKRIDKLIVAFDTYWEDAKANLKEKNRQYVADDKKVVDISEARIIKEALGIIVKKGHWKGPLKAPKYGNLKSVIVVDRHKLAYVSGNNHRVDFYSHKNKVKWQVINNFNANKKIGSEENEFMPECKKNGATPIWSLHQGDIIELDTPKQWRQFSKNQRCFAKIKKFGNRLNIEFHADARMDSPPEGSPSYMVIQQLGLGFGVYAKYKAQKVEFTPIGKIKKKHKKLWHGEKV